MPSRRIEQQLEALSALRAAGATEAAVVVLRKAMKDRVNLIVAKAASVSAQLRMVALIPDIVSAFDRLFENAAAVDPQCWGKNALAKALKDLGHEDSRSFVRGAKHFQMEPVWNGLADTATVLRGICILAAIQCTDLTREDKLWLLTRALTDGEATVRVEAVRALEEMEGREAAFLLRLKARMGDSEPAVIGQALTALLGIEREAGLPFCQEFLEAADPDLQLEAALALGTSKMPAAAQMLIEHWKNPKSRACTGILKAISATRQEDSFQLLLDLVHFGTQAHAAAAIEALALHRGSAEVRLRAGEAVATRNEACLSEQFRQQFGPV